MFSCLIKGLCPVYRDVSLSGVKIRMRPNCILIQFVKLKFVFYCDKCLHVILIDAEEIRSLKRFKTVFRSFAK